MAGEHTKKHTVPPATKLIEYLQETHPELRISNHSREAVINGLASHLDKIVYNILALSSTIAEIQEREKVLPEDMDLVEKYISNKCGVPLPAQSGGGATVLPPEYFGNDSGKYTPGNAGTDRNTLDLAGGVIRDELQMAGGAAPLLQSSKIAAPLLKHMMQLAREKNVQISRYAKLRMQALLMRHIGCLVKDLQYLASQYKSLTASRLSVTLAKKRHAIFW